MQREASNPGAGRQLPAQSCTVAFGARKRADCTVDLAGPAYVIYFAVEGHIRRGLCYSSGMFDDDDIVDLKTQVDRLGRAVEYLLQSLAKTHPESATIPAQLLLDGWNAKTAAGVPIDGGAYGPWYFRRLGEPRPSTRPSGDEPVLVITYEEALELLQAQKDEGQ